MSSFLPHIQKNSPQPTNMTEIFSIKENDLRYLNSFPLGYRFYPRDEELIYYLRKKISNEVLPPNKIVQADLYLYHPQALTERYNEYGEDNKWYFFTERDRKYPKGRRPNRAVGNSDAICGYWKATSADRVIKFKDVVGSKRSLVFYEGKQSNGNKTNWIMHEYAIKDPSQYMHADDDTKRRDWALCRIHNRKEKDDDNGVCTQKKTFGRKRPRYSSEEEALAGTSGRSSSGSEPETVDLAETTKRVRATCEPEPVPNAEPSNGDMNGKKCEEHQNLLRQVPQLGRGEVATNYNAMEMMQPLSSAFVGVNNELLQMEDSLNFWPENGDFSYFEEALAESSGRLISNSGLEAVALEETSNRARAGSEQETIAVPERSSSYMNCKNCEGDQRPLCQSPELGMRDVATNYNAKEKMQPLSSAMEVVNEDSLQIECLLNLTDQVPQLGMGEEVNNYNVMNMTQPWASAMEGVSEESLQIECLLNFKPENGDLRLFQR